MKKLLIPALVFLLSGCVARPGEPPPPPDINVTVESQNTNQTEATATSIATSKSFIIKSAISQKALMNMDNRDLYDYVTTLNWDLFRHYSTMRVVNQYAQSRGWSSPKTDPICRYARIPDIPDMKQFNADSNANDQELAEMLMVYIYDIQTEAEMTKAVYESNVEQMRFFCIY